MPFPIRLASQVLVLLLPLGGCLEPEVDRIDDPVEKAAYHCRYVIERAIATPDQLRADGVLRRRIATFAEPEIARTGDVVRFEWPAGAIVEDGSGSHGGNCTMDLSGGQQLVVSASLDGRPLHAGFRF